MRQTTNDTMALQSLMAEFIRLVAYQNEKPVFDDEGMVALGADNTSPVYFSTRQVIAIARLLKGMTKPQGWRDGDMQIIYELAAKAEQRESDDGAVLTFIAHPSDARQMERHEEGALFPTKYWEGERELPGNALTPSSKKEIADYMLEAVQQDPEDAFPLHQPEPGATWFAPRNSVVEVDGIPVPTAINEFSSANILSVEVGTNGFQGGDTGHGGRTYLRIKDEGCTDLRCRVKASGRMHRFGNACSANEIEIILGGDTELGTFSSALRFAADVLEKKITGELMLVVPANYKKQ